MWRAAQASGTKQGGSRRAVLFEEATLAARPRARGEEEPSDLGIDVDVDGADGGQMGGAGSVVDVGDIEAVAASVDGASRSNA